MKRCSVLKFWLFISILSIFFQGCSATAPKESGVVLGYFSDSGGRSPAAFFDYQPGVTIKMEGMEAENQKKETITYPSGKPIEIIYTMKQDSYEANINGEVKQGPSFDEYTAKIKPTIQNKLGFDFMFGGISEPLMQIPSLCPENATFEKHYSQLPDREWIKSLDTMTFECPSTKKKYTFLFTYVRDLTKPESFITGFTVAINEEALK